MNQCKFLVGIELGRFVRKRYDGKIRYNLILITLFIPEWIYCWENYWIVLNKARIKAIAFLK